MSQRFPLHSRYAQRPSHPSRYEHSDRWNGRPTQRSRSPTRDRRDSRDFPPPPQRDILPDRAPRYPREGPPSAGPIPPDHTRYPPAPYARGRGRPGDWEFRGRRPYPDDRDPYRRSPSRGPRRERQGSVDSHDYERRDDRRDDFRDHREEEWRYRRPPQEFPRRDPPPRIDSRHASDARSDSMPSPNERGGRQPSPHRRQSPVDKRDYETPRRPSLMDHAIKDGRREPDRLEGGRPQRDRSPDRTQTRPAEETSSVAVPQFGAIPQFLATPVKTAASPILASKVIPTAPRAQLSASVPTGPKADRQQDRPIVGTKDQVPTAVSEDVKPKELLSPPIAVNVLPATLPQFSEPSIRDSTSTFRTQSLEASPSFMAKQLIPPSAPTGPRSSSQPLGRASSAGPPVRDVSPSGSMTSMPPAAPRGSIPQLTKGLPDNIPTAPRAMAMNRAPPTAPRNHRQQATSWQWRPNEPTVPARAPSIPAKRDANGEEKERTPVPERPFELARAGSSMTYNIDVKKPSDSPVRAFLSLASHPEKFRSGIDEDIRMVDVPSKSPPISPDVGMGHYSSDDDEDQELTEKGFIEQAEIYRQRKAELEVQLENFDRRHRATTPLQELDKGNAILAIVDEMRLANSPEPSPAPIIDTAMAEEAPTKSPTPEEPPSPVPSAMEAPVIPPAPRELTPEMSKSPDFEYLPYLQERPPTPISNPEQLEDAADDELRNLIDAELQEMECEKEESQAALGNEFKSLYSVWKRNALIMDRELEVLETTVPQAQIEVEIPEPSVEQPLPPLPTPTESRRSHKWSSELDFERALEESRLLEEQRQLKAEKDKIEAAANVEREAKVPTILTGHEMDLRRFKDTSLLRNPKESLRVFEFAPPEDTLTPEQSREFTKLWKKHPKMWHMIADSLGLKTKECIYHYYATKWDKPYKGGKARKPKKTTLAGNRRGLISGRGRLEIDAEGQEAAVGLTETGRPRRAAAPVFSKPIMGRGDLEAEVDSLAPAGKRSAGNKTDNGLSEGRGSGRGKVPREKPARKPRNQPLVAKTGMASSPQKIVRERKDKASSVTPAAGEGEEWNTKRESVPPPALVQQQHQQHQHQPQLQTYLPEPPNMYRDANLAPLEPTSGTPEAPVRERPRSHSNTQKQNASSYWSVTEETEFQSCLIHYGTDFQQISAHINKKTPVMIKNHYHKYRHDPTKQEIILAAEHADQRRARGEPSGELPPGLKKSLLVQQAPLRSLMPNDPMDNDSPPSINTVNIHHNSPSFRPQHVGHGMQPHSTPPSKVAMPSQGLPGQPVSGPGSKQSRMAYYHDSPSRQQPAQGQPHMSPPMMMHDSAAPKSTRIKTEHNPSHPIHRRERSNMGDALTAAQRDQDIPQGLPPYKFAPNSSHLGPSYGPQVNQPFGGKELLAQESLLVASAPSRKVIDLTGPPSSGYDKFPTSTMMSGEPPAMQDYRYNQQNLTPPAAHRGRDTPSTAPAANEPPRRVNIMSMLNPEPSEEKPPRKDPEPQSRSHHGPESVVFKRDPHNRESHHRPTLSIHDREPAVSAPSQRDARWPGQPYPFHPYPDSPHLAPQQNHRAALGSLNTHSRNSSYSAVHQPQHGSNPNSAAGTPTEPFARNSFRGNAPFSSGPPLAPAQSVQPHHSRDVSYSTGGPAPAVYTPQPDRRDTVVDGNASSAYPPLRAFRNISSHDYVDTQQPPGQPGSAGPPPPGPPGHPGGHPPPSHYQPPPYGGGPGGPPSLHAQSHHHHPSHSSPQPPPDPRYQPPPQTSRGPPPSHPHPHPHALAQPPPHATLPYERGGPGVLPQSASREEQRYQEMEIRRRDEEMRRAGAGGPPQPPPGQQQQQQQLQRQQQQQHQQRY